MKGITNRKEIWLLGLLIAIFFIVTSINGSFLSWENIRNTLRVNSLLFILSMGMTLIIITGGIDVSVAPVVATVAMVVGRCIAYWGFSPVTSILMCLALGLAFGLINGVLIGVARIPAIVATLGVMSITDGAMLWISNSEWVLTTEFPEWFKNMGQATILGVPFQIWITLLMIVVTWFIMNKTMLGRQIYALGGSAVAANRIGINITKVLLFVYLYMGMLVGIGTYVHMSLVAQVEPNMFDGFEMDVIAAVVVGGASMSGGVGTVSGTVIGVLFMSFVQNGLTLMRVSSYWQQAIVGFVMLLAVTVDIVQRRRSERRLQKIDVME